MILYFETRYCNSKFNGNRLALVAINSFKDRQWLKANQDLSLIGQLIKLYITSTQELVKYHIKPSTSHSKTLPTAVTAPRC